MNQVVGHICIVVVLYCLSCSGTHLSRKVGRLVPDDHLSYYYEVYGKSPKDTAIHGAYAINTGIIHKEALKSANELISSGILQSFFDGVSIAHPPVSNIITVYIDVWRASNKDHLSSEDKHIDGTTALDIYTKEYSRIGVYEELDLLKDNLAKKITMYDQEKYRHTYEAFAISSELILMAKKPTGSLRSFSKRWQRLSLELERLAPLAEIESI